MCSAFDIHGWGPEGHRGMRWCIRLIGPCALSLLEALPAQVHVRILKMTDYAGTRVPLESAAFMIVDARSHTFGRYLLQGLVRGPKR